MTDLKWVDPADMLQRVFLSTQDQACYTAMLDHADQDGVYRFGGTHRTHRKLPEGVTMASIRRLAAQGVVQVVTVTHNYWNSPAESGQLPCKPHVITEVWFTLKP